MLTHKEFFTYGMLGLNTVYIAVAIGVLDKKPVIIKSLDFWIKVYMGLYLIWRFNPFFPGTFTDFDRRIVFAAGTFLFSITIVDYYFKDYVTAAKDTVKSVVGEVRSEYTS
jgi:hypothetical protein